MRKWQKLNWKIRTQRHMNKSFLTFFRCHAVEVGCVILWGQVLELCEYDGGSSVNAISDRPMLP